MYGIILLSDATSYDKNFLVHLEFKNYKIKWLWAKKPITISFSTCEIIQIFMDLRSHTYYNALHLCNAKLKTKTFEFIYIHIYM